MDKQSESSSNRDCEEILFDDKRGQLRFDRGQIARRPLRFLLIMSPFLLSHHPFCSEYDHHIFVLRGRNLCLGCFFNTLFFSFSILTLFFIWIIDETLLDARTLFQIGLVGILCYFPVTLINRSEIRKLKILSKLVLSSSFALICWSILLNNGLLSPGIEYKLILIIFLYLFVVILLSTKRIIELSRTCEKCEYKMRWSRCPGFRDILCDLIEDDFLYPENKYKKTE